MHTDVLMAQKEDKYCTDDSSSQLNTGITYIIGYQETEAQKEERSLDQQLWLALKVGSAGAFKSLFLKYNNILTKYGNSIIRDSSLIEDCVHDLFLYIWSNRERLTEVESVKYYLIVSFRRRMFKAIEDKEKGKRLLEGIKHEYPRHEDFFEKKFITLPSSMEKERLLNLAVEGLPARQKEVLQLRYIEGMSYQEIVTKMKISNVSARKLASKAIKNLRKKNI